MGAMKTGKDGTFLLDGTTDESTDIDPVLKIYHNCNDKNKDGAEIVSLKLTGLGWEPQNIIYSSKNVLCLFRSAIDVGLFLYLRIT